MSNSRINSSYPHPRINAYSNPRNQNAFFQNQMTQKTQQEIFHMKTRQIESDRKQEDLERTVTMLQYTIGVILTLGAAALLYYNADTIKPHLQKLSNLKMDDVKTAAANGWKDTTAQFEKAKTYLASFFR
jgi:hypothetical protein